MSDEKYITDEARCIELHIKLGRKTISLEDFQRLECGSMLDLDQSTNAPLSIYANDILIAHGEMVLSEECYRIRIIELTLPPDMRDLLF